MRHDTLRAYCSLLGALFFGAGCEMMSGGHLGSAAADAEGFVSIFNGADLTGWVQVLDSTWKVEDGILLSHQDPKGRQEGESWLLTERDYGDFELRLEFRITQGGNSGVFLRDPVARAERLIAADGAQPPWETSYEVNINNDELIYPTGSIWATAKGVHKLQKEGEWNELRVKLEGQRISTWINGEVALEGVELPERTTRGAIGFQRHGGEAYREKLIEFRAITIRELGP